MEDKQYRTFTYAQLEEFTRKVFIAKGFNESNATIAAKNLCIADLRGIDSHGVARLSGFVKLIEKGRLNPTAEPKVVKQKGPINVIDADGGAGLVAAELAMQQAIEQAKVFGCGFSTVFNSNHFGIAGNYAMMAADAGFIGMAMTNASPLVAPTFSIDKLLGTNPIAFATPSKSYPHFVADFATTTAANGKLEILQRKSEDTPSGWVQQADGEASINPNELKNGGALLPLGSDYAHGSHKGFCLGAMVDIFSGVMSGANFSKWVPPFVAFLDPLENLPGKGIGHFFAVWDPDTFSLNTDFKAQMDIWIESMKSAATVKGIDSIVIPGEPEWLESQRRKIEGIPLINKVVEDLTGLAKELSIKSLVYKT